MPCWLQILQGLLTPVIALVAVYIAWQQYHTAKTKLKMDWYERRLRIYQETHKFISMVIRDLKPEIQDMFTFYAETAEADFLFLPEIRVYLDKVFTHANLLHSAKSQYRDIHQEHPPDYDHQAVCDEMKLHTDWFIKQPVLAKDVFKPYLRLEA